MKLIPRLYAPYFLEKLVNLPEWFDKDECTFKLGDVRDSFTIFLGKVFKAGTSPYILRNQMDLNFFIFDPNSFEGFSNISNDGIAFNVVFNFYSDFRESEIETLIKPLLANAKFRFFNDASIGKLYDGTIYVQFRHRSGNNKENEGYFIEHLDVDDEESFEQLEDMMYDISSDIHNPAINALIQRYMDGYYSFYENLKKPEKYHSFKKYILPNSKNNF